MVSDMAKLPKYVHEVDGRLYFRRVRLVNGKQKVTRHRLPALDAPDFSAEYHLHLNDRPRVVHAKGTFAELIAIYKGSAKFSGMAPTSRRNRAYYLDLIGKRWGAKPYAMTPKAKIHEWQDELQATPGKANQLMISLSALFTFAVKREMMKINPCLLMERLEVGEHQPWPETVLTDTLTAASPMLALAIKACLYTGQRIGDVCAMRWNQVQDGMVEVVQQKTGKLATIPLHREFAAALADMPRQSVFLLYNRYQKPFTPDALRGRLALVMGDKDYTFHGLRKNAVIALLEAGCSPDEVEAITRQTRKMIEHYSKQVNRKKLARSAVLKWERGGNSQ